MQNNSIFVVLMKKLFFKHKYSDWKSNINDSKKKILLLGLVIGLLAGIAAVVLKTAVHYMGAVLTNFFDRTSINYLYLAAPLFGILITVIFIKNFIREDISHGIGKILYSISQKGSKIKLHNTYSSIVGCIFTVGFGGSAGLEAPILFTGSAIGSNFGQYFKLNYKTTTLFIACGTSGAMAAIFKAPIAGLIFSLEVLMIDLTSGMIIPVLASSVTGTVVASFLLGKQVEFYFAIHEPFNLTLLPFYIILGLASGLVSLYYTRTDLFIEKAFKSRYNPYKKVIVGGLALGLLIFIFPPLYGEGYEAMRSILSGNAPDLLNSSYFYPFRNSNFLLIGILVAILLFKVVASAITTGSGGIGGIFAPSLFMGGLTGFIIAKSINMTGLVQLSELNYTLVGMAGLIAGVIHAPITAIFLIAEITGGYDLFIPLIITSTLSYITSKHFEPHSIYTKKLALKGQLLTLNKDQAILTLLETSSVIEKDLIPIYPEANLGHIVNIIAKSNRNTFPVVDHENYFMGIVSLDNIRNIIFDKSLYQTILVQDIMTQPLDAVSTTDPMEKVMTKFQESGLWNMPVIDNGKYVGFVSKSNVLSAYREKLKEFY
ncbi:MAG: chloride channel protein [Bacteroidota bacterium]|nr:chloride channel protein [Bacteroidota bacterium]